MKKRLLIFQPTIASYRVDFFNALHEEFEMRVCLRYENLKEQHFEDYQAIINKCEFSPIYLKSIFVSGSRVIPSGVISQIRSFNPDIVIGIEYAWETLAALWFRAVSGRNYRVMTICDDSYNMVAEGNDFTRVHKIMRGLLAPKMDEIILTAPTVRDWYRERYGKGIYFPIIRNEKTALTEYEDALPTSNECVRRFDLKGKRVFLSVGRLVGLKKVDDVINAFISAEIKDSVLVVVGSGECEDSLRRLANDNGNIIFTGRLEGPLLVAWYNIASVFILASRQEPFGAVTNEALLGGCNVLVSRQCGSSCLVTEEVNGGIFESGDVKSLSNLMKKYSDETVPDEIVRRRSKMNVSFSELFSELIRQVRGRC